MILNLLAAAIFWLPGVLAISSPACSKAPYQAFLPLSNYPPAQSFCSKNYPLPACTTTTTAQVTSPVTVTVTQFKTQATATVTTNVISTTTTAESRVTTLVTTTVATVTRTGTNTILNKRHALPTIDARADAYGPLFSAIQKNVKSVVGQFCTCIETQPACQTVTATATTMPTGTVTDFSYVTETVTVSGTTTVTVSNTVVTTEVVSVTATTMVTATITSSRCPAPPDPTAASTAPTRRYQVADRTCNQVPGYWFLLDSQLTETNVGCAGQVDPRCAVSACLSQCNARADCVAFLIQSNDVGGPARYNWACSTMGNKQFTREYDGAIYGDEYVYTLV